MVRLRIYLAGPSVFYPDAAERGVRLKHICAAFGLEGLWPADGEHRTAETIHAANLALIDGCQAVVADLTPFRGPHCDPGTAWELGYAAARDLPAFAWSERPTALRERIEAGVVGMHRRDRDGLLIEDFDLVDNLMIAVPLVSVHHAAGAAIAAAAAWLGAKA